MSDTDRSSKTSGVACAGAALVTLLVVQIIIGYEWLASGVTKVASGNFVSGLAANLKGTLDSAPHFYKSFLTGTVIPNARAFGAVIEVGEILVGIALIVGAVVWLARWSRLSDRARIWLLGVTMLAGLGGMFMALNFHLAAGGNHPWLIPADGFNETIGLDAMLVIMQGAYVVFCGYLLVQIRREHQTSVVTAEVHRGAIPAVEDRSAALAPPVPTAPTRAGSPRRTVALTARHSPPEARLTLAVKWAKLREVKTELMAQRHLPISERRRWLGSILRGHHNYYTLPVPAAGENGSAPTAADERGSAAMVRGENGSVSLAPPKAPEATTPTALAGENGSGPTAADENGSVALASPEVPVLIPH